MYFTKSNLDAFTNAVCFTGHRPQHLNDPDVVRTQLAIAIDKALAKGRRNFIVGGALGVDTWAFEILIGCKDYYPDIQIMLALPHPQIDAKWSAPEQKHFRALQHLADHIWICSGSYDIANYQKRNEFMVNHSTAVIACWNGKKHGGTFNCIKYAMDNDVVIYNALNKTYFRKEVK